MQGYGRGMITTARLRGLPLAESDLEDLIPLHRDERVLRPFGASPATEDETRAFLKRKLDHWNENGFGIWMFRAEDGTFVGRCGIHRWRGEVELGYIVRPELWGRGYATEMAFAVAGHAFTALAMGDLVAFTKADNAASRRVMEKVGFRFERDFDEDDERHVLYRLTARGDPGHR